MFHLRGDKTQVNCNQKFCIIIGACFPVMSKSVLTKAGFPVKETTQVRCNTKFCIALAEVPV